MCTSVLVMVEERGVYGLVFSNKHYHPFCWRNGYFSNIDVSSSSQQMVLPLFHSFSGMFFFLRLFCLHKYMGFRFPVFWAGVFLFLFSVA